MIRKRNHWLLGIGMLAATSGSASLLAQTCGVEASCGVEQSCGVEPTCGSDVHTRAAQGFAIQSSCQNAQKSCNCSCKSPGLLDRLDRFSDKFEAKLLGVFGKSAKSCDTCSGGPTCGLEPGCGTDPGCGAENAFTFDPACGMEASGGSVGCGCATCQSAGVAAQSQLGNGQPVWHPMKQNPPTGAPGLPQVPPTPKADLPDWLNNPFQDEARKPKERNPNLAGASDAPRWSKLLRTTPVSDRTTDAAPIVDPLPQMTPSAEPAQSPLEIPSLTEESGIPRLLPPRTEPAPSSDQSSVYSTRRTRYGQPANPISNGSIQAASENTPIDQPKPVTSAVISASATIPAPLSINTESKSLQRISPANPLRK